MVYWSGRPYQAFGLGAASYLQRQRFSRPKSMAAYRQWVLDFAGGGGGIPGAADILFVGAPMPVCVAMLALTSWLHQGWGLKYNN